MKAYVSDPQDLKQGPLYQETWDDMVINLYIPERKAYVSDSEDLKQDPLYQETWDDMLINFVAESLDVIQDVDWVISLRNSFVKHYELYLSDDEHYALLHRYDEVL
ncbi:hypothetical protein Pfo_022412, partial [Paulownia fortunei]